MRIRGRDMMGVGGGKRGWVGGDGGGGKETSKDGIFDARREELFSGGRMEEWFCWCLLCC